jgi:hypothetical protein
LWNPNAAANWNLLLTPAFGAYLHAINWRTLGKPERATANMAWVLVTAVFLAINVGTLFVPESKAVEGVMRFAGLGLLLGWYFTQGRSQARYVKESHGDGYVKKGWGLPLLVGVAGVGAYIAVIFFLAVTVYKPDPNELAAEVKPLILQEWQKKPELRGATIQSVTLVHKGGNSYTGFIDATLDGKSERLMLEVTHDGRTIMWQLKAPGN